MKRAVIALLPLITLLTLACQKSPYPGYEKQNSGVFYKLLAIGEEEKKAQVGDYITADIAYRNMSDSSFFNGRRRFQLSATHFSGSIDECFAMLSEGDSASFIISADDFFLKTLETQKPRFLINQTTLKVDIRLVEVQKEDEYQREKEAFLTWIEDFGDYEKVILTQFIEQKKISAKPTASGLFLVTATPGKGPSVALGDTVIVDFEGKFFNGKFFDSTKKRNEPFSFVYGQKWQVIDGLEEAIGLMRQGQKALVILPSNLAFGKDGSSTGIIPPFTSVVFEVELLNVIKGVPPSSKTGDAKK
ncbi:FKBP-type peptidyl-prolyl cis-trans isomerase [Williamwhitmania taraxaci]|nr:FKBP-type peptidyl-prolyl cis-trans isomerase [Williamwhitmania taraxaci]